MHDMNNDIAKVLISEEQLQAKVAELGAQISREFCLGRITNRPPFWRILTGS